MTIVWLVIVAVVLAITNAMVGAGISIWFFVAIPFIPLVVFVLLIVFMAAIAAFICLAAILGVVISDIFDKFSK